MRKEKLSEKLNLTEKEAEYLLQVVESDGLMLGAMSPEYKEKKEIQEPLKLSASIRDKLLLAN